MINFKDLATILLLPGQCVLCGFTHRQRGLLCVNCIPFLPEIKAGCERCALPLLDASGRICGQCLKTPPLFSRVHAHYHYVPPINGLLHRYKYHHQLYLAALFFQCMVANPPSFLKKIDALIPIPVHSSKLRERGFNPVAEIARRLAKHFALPFLLHNCIKIRATSAQAILDKQQREKNLCGSFLARDLEGKRILLLDDLMTTGSTLKEASQTLLRVGAAEVYGWCFARAGGTINN